MYLEFYGLREFPFNITPDPRFLYYTPGHKEAYMHIMYGIQQRKGFIELTGEVGCGKTTLCRAVLAELGSSVETALVLNPQLTGTQLIRAILQDFGLTVKGRDRLTFIDQLNQFLLSKYRDNINVALIIDEAQNLSPELMEQVRLLSNLETDQHKLLQMVLCGQPELKKRLERPDLRQLRQRITVRYHIHPLTEEETMLYIQHRLWVAGANGGLVFDPKAVREVYKYSKGTPRVINNLCDNSLLAGFVRDVRLVDVKCVRRAVAQLEGKT
ncbi:MAG: AAA family ATPase [Verrucomicrobia bacterium]|nr:AAA family ATPase [Verrucomicrobiota bacterium]MDA1086208.1 AAA family ATPase [Verrucomicrobiota bacterium]